MGRKASRTEERRANAADASRDPAEVAQRLFERLGAGAAGLVAFRYETLARGDPPAAEFWADVGRALRALLAAETAAALETPFTPPPERAQWSLADRIVVYQQRAVEAERKAARGSAEFRDEMLEVAIQWADLAQHAALLAGDGDA